MQHVLVYCIEHLASERAYVGSTISISDRWTNHRWHLRKNTHHALKLQALWNKYGQDGFKFRVLEEKDCLSKEDRIAFEAEWVSRKGSLNSRPVAENLTRFSASQESIEKVTRALLKAHLERPELGENISASNYATWKDPITRMLRIENRKRIINTPEGKETWKQSAVNQWKNEAQRESKLRGINANWSDSVKKAARLEKSRLTRLARKNSSDVANSNATLLQPAK